MSLTQRVDRRIRDLREALLTVVPERPAQARHGGGRCVVAHAPHRFLPLFHQRQEEQAELILAPAERCHGGLGIGSSVQKRLVGGLDEHGRHRSDGTNSLSQPQRIFGTNELSALRIHQQNFSGPQPLPLGNLFVLQVRNANLGANHQQAVLRQGVTQRTQAIAVKLRAYSMPIGEDQGSRTVPRLLQADLLFQKVTQLRRGLGRALPCRGNHRQHGLGRGVLAAQKNFEAVVKAGRVADPLFEQSDLIGKSQFPAQGRRFGPHPAPIAADGVDLAIVGDKAEGLRHRPARLGVGGVALMENREQTFKIGVAQVGVKRGELKWREQSFVNHDATGERTEISSGGSCRLGFLPETEEKKFKIGRFCIRRFRSRSEKTLLDHGQRIVSARTENRGIVRHRTPSQTIETAFLGLRFNGLARRRFLTRRQKYHPQSELRGQSDTQLMRSLANQFIGNACEQARTIAAPAIGIHTPAMHQPYQGLERAVDDLA